MKNTRVLIVEDDAGLARNLRDGLGGRVLDAETTGTLGEAMARLAVTGGPSVGCVVLDLVLPDAKGIEAVERVVEAHPEIPVVVLTGHAELRVPAVTAGAQDAILKPATLVELADAVELAIARKRVMRRFAPHTGALDAADARIQRQLEQSPPAPDGGSS